jgi:hypothetical protein
MMTVTKIYYAALALMDCAKNIGLVCLHVYTVDLTQGCCWFLVLRFCSAPPNMYIQYTCILLYLC